MSEVRCLTLHRGRFEKTRLYKVKKNWKIIFKLAPEFLAQSDISFHINYPVDGENFCREKYQSVNIKVRSYVSRGLASLLADLGWQE